MRYKKTAMRLNDDNTCDDLVDADKVNHCEGDVSSPTGDMQLDAAHLTSPPPLQSSCIASFEIEQGQMDREEDNKSTSCGVDAMDTSDQRAQVAECQTTHQSPYDNIDGHLESRKRGRLTKVSSAYKPSECHEQDENMIKSNKADELPGTFSQTSPENHDEYDIEEEDVKVCDICGDAGREDLLAVCSRCSDGAEHTYCMRKMLDKVPDGDWLCEECKYNEELEERKLEHYKMHGMGERSRFLGRTSSVNNDFAKSDGKDPLRDRSKMKNVGQNKQVFSKRPGDSFEAGPASKRQAVESSMGSPTASSSSRAAAVKDNRSVDKIKGKSFNKIPAGIESTGDSSETVRSPTTNSLNAPKGNFTKSNSFSTGNSKLNVKLPDELQKKKHGVDAKDMPGKLITKSMSFKGLGRSNVSEPKVKMLSSHFAPVQELKSLKQGRERTSLERKNTIKPDQFTPDQMTTITSKHPSRGENISSLSVTNNRDHKNCQPDGKLSALSKHSFQSQSQTIHKLSEATDNTGEVKKQSSTSISGSVPVNGTGSSAEARPNPVSITELPGLSLARSADRSVIGDNGAKTDVLDNQKDKTVENSFGRLRQGVNGGNRRELSTDSSISRTKEGIHKENNLKAAIEAAMQKKQDMFRKNRNLDKSNELSTSNSQGNHVGVAVLNVSSDASSEEGVLDGDAALRNHISSSCKSASGGSMKQLKVYPAGGGTSVGDSVLTVSAIPEQESVWQGGFEIHRNGKFPDMCGGFQAHLSSAAAGKVVELVKKFPQKIVLDEVPRPCVWPMQFKEIGARENNVALYFFAKDSESYIRSYKMLVDYLMKHDLALRGHVNEVELLVFPSNHLPDKSQCWNAFFFMWGVFRGRRPLCPSLQETAEICMSPDVNNVSGSRNLVVSRCDTPASVRSGLQHPDTLSNGDCYNDRFHGDRSCLSSHPSSEKPLMDFSRSGAEASESAALNDPNDQAPVKAVNHQRLAANKIDGQSHLESHMQDKQDISSHSCVASLVSGQAGGLVVGSEQHRLDIVNNTDRVKCENSLKPDVDCVDNIKKKLGKVKVEDDVKHRVDGIDPMQKNDSGKLKLEGSSRQEGYVDINISADNNTDELQKMRLSPCEDSTNSTMQAVSVVTPWMNEEDPLEGRDDRRIRGDDLNGLQSYLRSNDEQQPQRHGVSTTSLHTKQREDIGDEADGDKSGSSDAGLAKRYLFLDDSHPDAGAGVESGLGDESVYWKVGLSEQHVEWLPDGSPNLELALGVEKKQSRSERPPADIVAKSSKEEKDEDASASLSLSLAFPFSDKERTASRLGRSPSSVEVEHTSLLLFRGSSHK